MEHTLKFKVSVLKALETGITLIYSGFKLDDGKIYPSDWHPMEVRFAVLKGGARGGGGGRLIELIQLFIEQTNVMCVFREC